MKVSYFQVWQRKHNLLLKYQLLCCYFTVICAITVKPVNCTSMACWSNELMLITGFILIYIMLTFQSLGIIAGWSISKVSILLFDEIVNLLVVNDYINDENCSEKWFMVLFLHLTFFARREFNLISLLVCLQNINTIKYHRTYFIISVI